MAKCGMREESEKWLRYGIRSSLIYGYHKDVILLFLIDVLKLVNRCQPDMALERCARVLWMVKWMPHLTNGRETKYFTKDAFSTVLAANRSAAFDLLKQFSRSIARWQMQNCMKEYLLSAVDGDPEYLWCLSESFVNHSGDDGGHCKQIIGSREHIVNLVRKFCSEDVQQAFEDRFRHFVLTEITPRHWPDQFKDEFSIPHGSNGERGGNAISSDHQSSDFMLDGEIVTREGIAEKCRESFSEFLVILEKLETENEHFYERDLLDVTLSHHITEARSPKDLIPIKEYVESQGRWQNQNVIECLAERFLQFGDDNNAIACFGMAYECYDHWLRWRRNGRYLAAIAEKDKRAAKTCLLDECYDSVAKSEGGYDTTPTAATGLAVLNKPRMLEAVFNDFLIHCESMFAQLPQDNDYAWLKEYAGPTCDENQLILQFSMEDLGTPEIDHGERLIRALTRLAIARPKSAIPVLIDRTPSASGRVLRRLLMILHALAGQRPDLLASHQQTLAKLLDRENFFIRQSVMHILRYLSRISPLKSSVTAAVQSVERKYSASISHSSYRMSSNPSSTFSSFLKRNTLFHFSDQVSLMEKILQVQPGSLVAALEERLNTRNWSMDAERSRIKDDWYGRVEPEGWPVVWITTEFQELVTEVLWSILNEAVEKMKLSHDQIYWLWQATQMVDPEYVDQGIMPRPLDIETLHVVDKEVWFREFDTIKSLQIGDAGTEEQGSDWITVSERRRLTHDEKYNGPYKQEISLQATLIPMQVYGYSGAYELDELELTTEPIALHPAMGVTLEQARDVLTNRGSYALDVSDDCIPLIAEHQNSPTFLGYWSVCSLASFIIEEFNLLFEGFDLTKDGEVVAKYEAWQEGYQDGAYTREKISFGVRLRVRRDFLAAVCRRYQRMLCIRINERREYYNSIHKCEPDTSKDSKRYVIYHL